MRALRWYGKEDVRVEQVPDPAIINPRDAIVRITSTCICGSDLHMYDGYIPTMQPGDILGHEFMGEVVALGKEVTNVKLGDRVVVPFTIACGSCFFCQNQLWSCCDNTNPNAHLAEAAWGYSPSGLFGYSHMTGGYAGGQAEYARVPFADVGLLRVPEGMPDEHVIFLSDIFPTGYMAAELCELKPGQVVAVWGCGPVGQFAIRSAFMLGADRVIAIDRFAERLAMARAGGAEVIDYEQQPVLESLRELTAGRGPDACIEAVGMEAHGAGAWGVYDKLKQAVRAETERPIALREAIMACRKGGIIAVPGVYGGVADKIPLGAIVNKALTLKSGQTHVHRYMRPLLERVRRGEIDPSFVITHRLKLDQAPEAYRTFRDKQDGCIKVVMSP